MNLFSFSPRLGFRGVLALAAGAAGVALLQRYFARRRPVMAPDSVPQTAGAKSAVTGGAPEDINGMPPVPMEKNREATIYDGSDLSRHKAS